LETTVKEEAALRAKMDEDLSGLKIQKRMLQALADTQASHGRGGNMSGSS
jgi:hypothetical protein